MSIGAAKADIVSGYCQSCDYILNGLQSSRCPECGHAFDPDNSATYFPRPAREMHQHFRRIRRRRTLIAFVILFPLELICGFLAYETLSEIDSSMILLAAVILNGFALVLAFARLPRVALVMVLLIGVLIIPHQAWLGIRLLMLNRETQSIINYVESQNCLTGRYPATLVGYQFNHQMNFPHINYVLEPSSGGYRIYWHVGRTSTSHSYTPRYGFGYYPD